MHENVYKRNRNLEQIMKQLNYTLEITGNRQIADNTYEMTLEGAGLPDLKPGQFINIKLDGFYLRRPISICNFDGNTLTIIYKAVGSGTEAMRSYLPGKDLDILLPLGNGYTIPAGGRHYPERGDSGNCENGENSGRPLLIGGGAGVPPMYYLCKTLTAHSEKTGGEKPIVILGFNTESEIFYKEKFEELGVEVIIATADGSAGVKGFVTDCIEGGCLAKGIQPAGSGDRFDCFCACGPEGMLRAIDEKIPKEIPGQMSFEERMGCGFGACMGCSCRTKYGNKRICKDGPVLDRAEVIW